jgi:hypothetical protein
MHEYEIYDNGFRLLKKISANYYVLEDFHFKFYVVTFTVRLGGEDRNDILVATIDDTFNVLRVQDVSVES